MGMGTRAVMNASNVNNTGVVFHLTTAGVATQLTVFFITFVLGVVGNIVLVLTVYKRPALHRVTYYLVSALAIEDTLALLNYGIFYPQAFILGDWFLGDSACFMHIFLIYLSGCCELNLMAVISLDRYFACCRPLRYSHAITPLRCAVAIACCGVYAIALALFLMVTCQAYGYDEYFKNCLMELSNTPKQKHCSIVGFFLSNLPCTTTIAVCQWKILKQVKRVTQNTPPNVTSGNNEVTSGNHMNKATMTVTLMTGTYVTSWLPFVFIRCSGIFVDWKQSESLQDTLYILRRITFQIFMVSKFANPIIYGIYNREFRTQCGKLLCSKLKVKVVSAQTKKTRAKIVVPKF